MIDLSQLEFGDAIEVAGGKIKAVISVEIRPRPKCRPDKYVLITASKPRHKDDEASLSYESFTREGLSLQLGGDNITRVLKNKIQWTDEDMLSAFYASATNENSCKPLSAQQWLEQYKLTK